MKRALFFCLLAFTLASAQKQRLAVLPSVGDLDAKKLDLLTDKTREIASKILPQGNFILLRQDAVVNAIGAEEYFLACKEGTCIGELAKKANANYGARCDVFKVDNNLVLKFELYSVKDEAILETFTDYDAKDFYKMLAVLEERLPGAFKKIIERSYLAILDTDPQGASLSFNGVSIDSCPKTPCKLELRESQVRILAALEQHETADTTVSITRNNQAISIKLKPNVSVLEMEPVYSEADIGKSMEAKPDSVPDFSGALDGMRQQGEEIGSGRKSRIPFWLAIALDVAGATFIGIGYRMDLSVSKNHDEYNGLAAGQQQIVYDNAWERVERAKGTRNQCYVFGAIALASGIGVHIWF